jgi:serine/threonine-protein kinase
MACSFGEIDGEPNINDVEIPVEGAQPAPGGQQDPGGAVDPGNTGNNGNTGNTGNTGTTPAQGFDPDEDPFQSTLGKEVKAILETNCGQCHQGTASGGMDYILNLQALITNGKVVPGNKEDSQLFVRMQQQSMPPAFIRDQRPTFGQIDQVGLFIDELDPAIIGGGTPCSPLPFFNQDDQIAAMAQDIQNVDAEDQPFTRYLTITYASNAGECERAVQRQRYALFKGINSVSTEAQIGIPRPIDSNETIYRIDIRDYNWDRDIDLEDDGVVDFADGWLAIVDGSGEYGVEYTGDDADDLKADTATAVPFLPVNAFVRFTEKDDLYYTLIGAKANLFEFERDVLLIDTVVEIEDNNLLRAGFSNSGVSKQERVLNRFEQNTAGGLAYWISFDFDGDIGANESIYQDPLDFAFAGGEAIFNLPNGMQAYYVANAVGQRLGEAPIGVVIDPAQNNGLVTNGASCHSCHNAGMITFTDTVRQYVVENRIEFDNDTYEDVLEQYPDQKTFQRAMDADSELHVSRVEEAGVPRTAPDPITRVFLDFDLGNIDATLAAGELHVTKDELLQNLQLLDPKLTNLGEEGGYVSRTIFTAAYVDALCQLHAVDENIPANCP